MSSLEQEERENFNKLKKLVFQVGLSSIRELFLKRYSQKYGNWEETPEFGEKLLKMLDDGSRMKGEEILKKYEERENIKSGKVSEWDYTTLQFILSNLDFGNSSTSSNYFTAENKMVEMLTQVGNKLVHEYSKEKKIPTNEFLGTLDKLWKRIYDSFYDLGDGKEVMDNIMELYAGQNKRAQKKPKKNPSFPPAQTSDSGTVNTTNNPAKQEEEAQYAMLPFMFLHGIFLLVISSLFLSRLVHFSAGIPNIDWMIFTIIAVCLGALRIILPLSCLLLLLLKDPKARSWFWIMFGFVYLLTVLSFGLLVMLFKFTNIYSETFLNYDDVEGIKNNRLYNWLFWAIVVEPALLCIVIVLIFVVGLSFAIGAAVKRCL